MPRSSKPTSPPRTARVLAIAAHPDDIEFMMAGTLLLLREAGLEVHYLNLSTGNLGSMTRSSAATARVRRREAQSAAAQMDAVWHPPICNDLQIFYDDRTLRRLAAIVREVDPSIILTHSPQDYMEDHMNTCRLVVTAAFARGVPNYRTVPAREPVQTAVTIYHGSPHGLQDSLRRRVMPEAFVDTTTVHERKRAALECHKSQQGWLDATQGMNSYIATMEGFAGTLGAWSGKFTYCEGWRRHAHWGYGEEADDPLRDALKERYLLNPTYKPSLERP